jgi:hypothetical protein
MSRLSFRSILRKLPFLASGGGPVQDRAALRQVDRLGACFAVSALLGRAGRLLFTSILVLAYAVANLACIVFLVPVAMVHPFVVSLVYPLLIGALMAKVGRSAISVVVVGPFLTAFLRLQIDDVAANWISASAIWLLVMCGVSALFGVAGVLLGRRSFPHN